jgi:hypothetical protein
MSIHGSRLELALLTADTREILKAYEKAEPDFGTAPQALLHGLALLPGMEVPVVCCIRSKVNSPFTVTGLSPNVTWRSIGRFRGGLDPAARS